MKLCGRSFATGQMTTVTIRGERIVAVEEGCSEETQGDAEVWIAPGFLDLQLNGYGGHDFNISVWDAAPERAGLFGPIYEAAARSGAALICPTITTNSFSKMRDAFQALTRALRGTPGMDQATAGFHLEGPYISSEDGPRGSHPVEHVRDPDWDEFLRLQEAAEGRILLCTVAPERPGALRFIERLAASGVTPAIGHTGAEPGTIRAAVECGARLATHLGNGAHATIPRHPNYLWEQLASDALYATVIADGHHLPAAVLTCFARVKGPDRLALISDAVSLGGRPPGLYGGGRFEVLPGGKVVLAGTPYLAGAGHLLDTCVPFALRHTGFSLAEVVRCATEIPARILGISDRKGRLEPGYDADITLFRIPETGPLDVVATYCGGLEVYTRSPGGREEADLP